MAISARLIKPEPLAGVRHRLNGATPAARIG
jgi:hypothetical protein